MALLSLHGEFDESDVASLHEDVIDFEHEITKEEDLEGSLAYSIGYQSPVHVSLHPTSTYATIATQSIKAEDEKFEGEYVSVESFPFSNLSLLKCCQRDKRRYYKNIYMLSLVFLLLIGSHYGLVGIQSSINSERGLVTLAILNSMFVASVTIAPAIIWLLGIRNAMLLACVLQVAYVTTNYLLDYITLVPGAIIGGFSLGIVWVTANLYVSITAINLASTINVKPTIVIGKFGGIFYMFIALSLSIGNMISSIFFIAKDEGNCIEVSNMTNSSGSVCTCQSEGLEDDVTRYILVSIYGVFDILAIIVLMVGVGNLPRLVTDNGELRTRVVRFLKHSVLSIIQVHLRTRVTWLIPLFMLEGLEASYYLGTFTTDFVAQCYGLRYVGFAVAVWAFGSAISSFTSGRVVKYVKRFTLFILSTSLAVFLCLFLIFYPRVESFYLIFFVSFGFGISDGTIKTATSCLIGGRFPKTKTAAYSTLRLWVGVGLTLHFVLSIVLSHRVLLWIIFGTAVISLPLYALVDRNARCTFI